jgi:ribose 5-phosphate isomerase B
LRIAIAGDHAGFELKKVIKADLEKRGVEVADLGACEFVADDDYPDFARLVADAVRSGEADRGVVVCGSGVGVCVAANKHPGIRAGICHDTYSARQGVEHDDMNVVCLGERIIGHALAIEIVRSFVAAEYKPGGRFQRRLEKVLDIERKYLKDA